MADTNFNIIRFAGINLELEGEFVITAGIKPNVNTFITPYTEFNKLADVTADGSLEFFYNAPGGTTLPLRWDLMRIVDVEIAEWGSTMKDKGKVFPVKYRLQIADPRHRFESPRGGRLVNGEINKLPFDDTTGKDANGNPLTNNLEMVNFCLKAMGLTIRGPESLKDKTAVKDIEWRGSHAPTELSKILDQLGYAFIVRQDGGFGIVKIGEDSGELPTTDSVVPGGMVIPSTDRRGKQVVFSSFPTPAMNTFDINRLGTQGFELVCPDKDGKWLPQDEAVKSFVNVSAQTLVRNHFFDLPEAQRTLLSNYLYRCLRLNSTKFPRVRLYRELHEKGKISTNFQISARIAIRQQDGTWARGAGLVRLTPVMLLTPPGAGSIIVVRELIGNVNQTTDDPEAQFKEIAADEISARITAEAVEQDGGTGPWFTKYFFVGWDSKGRLSRDDARNAMALADAIVVSRPDLQLLQVNWEDANYEDLVSTCEEIKDRYLAVGGESKLHVFKGFARVNLTGRINEIRMTQSPPITKIKEMTWWLPQGHYLLQAKEASESAAAKEGFPNQGRSEAQRLAQGVAGATQPAVPIAPEPRTIATGKPHGVCRIDFRTSAGGGVPTGGKKYLGWIINGASSVGPAGEFKLLDGMTIGPAVLIINTIEAGTDSSHWIILGDSARPTYANFEYVGVVPASTPPNPAIDGMMVVTVQVPNPHETFFVVLSTDGGIDGTQTTAPTWTYTCKTLSNDTLATARTPEVGRPNGPAPAATRGIGYFDYEHNFKLLYAFEVHGTGSCVPA